MDKIENTNQEMSKLFKSMELKQPILETSQEDLKKLFDEIQNKIHKMINDNHLENQRYIMKVQEEYDQQSASYHRL